MLNIGGRLGGKPHETEVCVGKYEAIGRNHPGTMGKYQSYKVIVA